MNKTKKLTIISIMLCMAITLMAGSKALAANELYIDPILILSANTNLIINVDGTASDELSGEYPRGEEVTIAAPAVSGKTFRYWTNGEGAVISYNETLSLKMYADTAVSAVYGEAVEKQPVVAFLTVDRTSDQIIFNAIATAQSDITEAGVRYSNTKTTLDGLKGSEGVTVEKSDYTATNWKVNVTPTIIDEVVDENETWYAVVYASVGDKTYYSDVKAVKLSELSGGVSKVSNLSVPDLSGADLSNLISVTFDANDGEGAMEPQGMVKNTQTALNAKTFTRKNHTFKGWNTAEDGTGTAYTDGQSVTLGSDTTLYAQWEENTQTITAEDVTVTFGDTDKNVSASVTKPETDGGVISFAVKEGSTDYIDINASTGVLTIKKVPTDGKAYVTVTASETSSFTQTTKDVTITINKADSAVKTAPTTLPLKHTGSAQALATAGKAEGGEILYTLGENATIAPTEDWSTSIPTATDAGTYYVWYKVVGDENHNDSVPACVTTKILAEISATVTFKVVNGSWNEGEGEVATADKTVTITGYEGDTLKFAADQIPAAGSKPGDTYKAGSWDVTPSADTAITEDTTYTYTYVKKDSISKIVTFKVANGSWDDGTTADKTVTLTGYEGDTLKLAADQIPAVGTKPGDTYKTGSWNVTPSADTEITADTTYTYTYAKKDSVSKTVIFKVVNGSWDNGTTADKKVTLTGYVGDKLKLAADQIPAVGTKPGDTYKTGSWNVTPSADTEITADTTYTYTYAKKDSVSKTVIFKVVNGSWDNGTTADKKVTLTGYVGDKLKLAADQIPAVGSKPGDTYKAGSWNVTPSADTAITEDTTYTYTYVKEDVPVVVAPEKEDELSINAGFKVTQKGSKITIKWGKVKGATGYEVYAAYCGKNFSKIPAKRTTTKTSVAVSKIGGKKINLKKNFKVYVKAIKKDGNKSTQLAKTMTGHIVGRKNTKYTNAKSITLLTKTIDVEVGKTYPVNAKTVLVSKKKKQLSDDHATEFRYASANESIATVDKKGNVKGISAGTTKIYVYSRNGLAKAVSVTVK